MVVDCVVSTAGRLTVKGVPGESEAAFFLRGVAALARELAHSHC